MEVIENIQIIDLIALIQVGWDQFVTTKIRYCT
jgi:hypothetical protein